MRYRSLAAGLALLTGLAFAPSPAAPSSTITLEPFRVERSAAETVRRHWIDQMLATNEPGTWAPMRFSPSDDDLALLGLPSSKILTSRRYPRPTMVTRDGHFQTVQLPAAQGKGKTASGKGGGGSSGGSGGSQMGPTVTTFAGTGWFGIRPGAWLLLISGNSIGWCSMAHVYGTPGAYQVSTAGHCGKVGDTATVVAAFGNHAGTLNPILLDFGKFAASHDNSLGDDWALINVDAPWQNLVTPTMAAWGGPRGMYTATGSLVSASFPRNGLVPSVSVTPDPTLAQTIVHYGHGTAIGTGGTPRAAAAIAWTIDHFMFSGAIAPGDSGSGANTLTGDTVGANMEAAGIITHLWIDPLMRDGIGIMGGTRATQVPATLANGQIVPYPVPVIGLP